MLRAPFIKEFVDGIAVGTGVKHLRVRDVEGLPVRIAPIDEQREICKRISVFLMSIDRLEKIFLEQRINFENLNQSILAKAFRGDLVPQDPSDEPASVLLERIRAEREKLGTTKKKRRSSRKKKATDQLPIDGLKS